MLSSRWKLNNDLASVLDRLYPRLAWTEVQSEGRLPGMLVPYDLQHQRYLEQRLKEDSHLTNPVSLTLRIRGLGLPKSWHPTLVWHDLDCTLPLLVSGIAVATYLLPWRPLFSYIASPRAAS